MRPSRRTISSHSRCSGVSAALMIAPRSRPASTASRKPAASMARLSIRLVGPMTSGGVRARRSARASTSAASRSGRHDPVDQPDPFRLDGVDEVAGQQQLAGLLLADEVRHQQRDGRGPVADLGLAEPRALGRHDQVAGHRQLEAAGQRVAVDLGDDRLRAIEDAQGRRDVGRPGARATRPGRATPPSASSVRS